MNKAKLIEDIKHFRAEIHGEILFWQKSNWGKEFFEEHLITSLQYDLLASRNFMGKLLGILDAPYPYKKNPLKLDDLRPPTDFGIGEDIILQEEDGLLVKANIWKRRTEYLTENLKLYVRHDDLSSVYYGAALSGLQNLSMNYTWCAMTLKKSLEKEKHVRIMAGSGSEEDLSSLEDKTTEKLDGKDQVKEVDDLDELIS